jgi:hypothetical protein
VQQFEAVLAYTRLPEGTTPESVYQSSAGALWYSTHVLTDSGFRAQLNKLQLIEVAASSLVNQAAISAKHDPNTTDFQWGQQSELKQNLELLVKRRRHEYGLIYSDEFSAHVAEIKNSELGILSARFGQGPDVVPLTGPELKVEGVAGALTTPWNRLEQVVGLSTSLDPEAIAAGLFVVKGPSRFLKSWSLAPPATAIVGQVGKWPDAKKVAEYTELPIVEVIAINASAIRLLGGLGKEKVDTEALRPAKMKELVP